MLLVRRVLFSIVDNLSRAQKQLLLLLIDAFCAPLALVATYALVFSYLPLSSVGRQISWELPVIIVFAASASAALGMHRVQLKAYEAHAILRTAVVAALTTIAFGTALQLRGLLFPQTGIVLFGLLFFLLSVAVRMGLLQLLHWTLRQGLPRRRVLIYGAGNTGVQLAAALRSHNTISPVAFVDDAVSLQGMTVAGLRVYPSDRISMLAKRLEVDRVILAMPSVSVPKLTQLARRLGDAGLDVMSVPSFAQLVGEEALVEYLAPVVPSQFLNRRQVDEVLVPAVSAYVDRVVLVTGAGGSVGSELCRQLLPLRPRRLVLFEVSEIALYTIERELRELSQGLPVDIVPVLGSTTDSRMARMVIRDNGVQVVVHAAAYKHVPLVEANPIAGLANNVLGTRTMGDAACEAGVERFVLISTDKAVRPTNIMGASKRLAEMVVNDLARRSTGCVFSIVRFGNVLGSSGSVIPLFREQIARGGPITLTHEDVTRYFMTIAEAVRLVLLAGSFSDTARGQGSDVYVLDMGKPVRIRDLAQQMIEAAGYSVRTPEAPDGDIEIVVTGLRPGEKLHEEPLISPGLLTTPHPKILRAEATGLSELRMASALRAIRAAVATGDSAAAQALLGEYLEEYRDHAPPMVATLQ